MAGKRILKARGLWVDFIMVEPITERVLVFVGGGDDCEGGGSVLLLVEGAGEGESEVSRETDVMIMCGTWYFVWMTSMARVRLDMSVILTSERSLLVVRGRIVMSASVPMRLSLSLSLYVCLSLSRHRAVGVQRRGGGGEKKMAFPNSLGLELIGQYQIRVRQQTLVRRNHVLSDVQFPIVAHDRIQHPKETARLQSPVRLELGGNAPDRLDGLGTRNVPREHHVKVVEVRLFEALEKIGDFLRRDFGAFDLSVARMIA